MTPFGYCRVSSVSQENNYSLRVQKEKLLSHGILEENIISETGSASNFERLKLNKLLEKVKSGDSIYVTSTDRLARCTLPAMNLIENLRSKNIKVVSLDLGELSTQGWQELSTFLFLYYGKNELITRQERTKEGIAKAKLANKYKGRKTSITLEMEKKVEQRLLKNDTKQDIAKILNISRSTVYKIIKKINLKKNELNKRN